MEEAYNIIDHNNGLIEIHYYGDMIEINTIHGIIKVAGEIDNGIFSDIYQDDTLNDLEYDNINKKIKGHGTMPNGQKYSKTMNLDDIIFVAYSTKGIFNIEYNESQNKCILQSLIYPNLYLEGENIEVFGKYKGNILSKIFFDNNKTEILCINNEQVLDTEGINITYRGKIEANIKTFDYIVGMSMELFSKDYGVNF